MEKITILSCTNRANSNTLKVSHIYKNILSETTEVELFDFTILPISIFVEELYGKRTENFTVLLQKYISEAYKFVFVAPEYNGSFPGILKLFIDAVPPKEWADKKACLVGVANGRAGNLRGMEHLTGILNYLKVNVYHNRLPISTIEKILNADGKFISEEQQKVCEAQMDGFLKF
jgi:chromate reductase, NAD(P)H dehydrogenase (quinone)